MGELKRTNLHCWSVTGPGETRRKLWSLPDYSPGHSVPVTLAPTSSKARGRGRFVYLQGRCSCGSDVSALGCTNIKTLVYRLSRSLCPSLSHLFLGCLFPSTSAAVFQKQLKPLHPQVLSSTFFHQAKPHLSVLRTELCA